MALYFARHGQTIFGSQKRLEGVSDSLLTKKGKEQAKKLGFFLKDKDIKKIISSPLERSAMTARIVGKVLKMEIEIEEMWREMSYGEWDSRRKEDLEKEVKWRDRDKNKYTFIHPGSFKGIKGESYEILGKRLEKKFEKIKSNFPEENILIVSHLGILRSVKKYFEKISPRETIKFSPHNNQVIKLDKTNNGKMLTELIEL